MRSIDDYELTGTFRANELSGELPVTDYVQVDILPIAGCNQYCVFYGENNTRAFERFVKPKVSEWVELTQY